MTSSGGVPYHLRFSPDSLLSLFLIALVKPIDPKAVICLINTQCNQWNDLLEWEILRGTKTAFFVPNVIPLYPIHVIIKKGDYCAEEITKDVLE